MHSHARQYIGLAVHRHISARTQHQPRLLCLWVGEGKGVVLQRGMGLSNFKFILKHTKIEREIVTFGDRREGGRYREKV